MELAFHNDGTPYLHRALYLALVVSISTKLTRNKGWLPFLPTRLRTEEASQDHKNSKRNRNFPSRPCPRSDRHSFLLLEAISTWTNLHFAMDAGDGIIMTSTLTGNDVADPLRAAPLLDQILSDKLGHNRRWGTSTFFPLPHMEGWAGRKKPTTAQVETAMSRYEAIIGPRLRARSFSGEQAEEAGSVAILNRMLDAGSPDSVHLLNMSS